MKHRIRWENKTFDDMGTLRVSVSTMHYTSDSLSVSLEQIFCALSRRGLATNYMYLTKINVLQRMVGVKKVYLDKHWTNLVHFKNKRAQKSRHYG